MSAPARPELLAIFLNDHLAGATGGVEIAKRAERSNAGGEFSGPLTELRAEIEADRTTLLSLMHELGVARSRLKPPLAALGERLARLKPNGQLRGYSPLSRVIELESLVVGITGKLRLWILCRELVGERSDLDFDALAARAERQRERAERLQLRAGALL
ncbi:MAG TPA: hypothetical protein VGI73_01955 [Solirubrobacterales bacterium]|jgi:hypothetical protein